MGIWVLCNVRMFVNMRVFLARSLKKLIGQKDVSENLKMSFMK